MRSAGGLYIHRSNRVRQAQESQLATPIHTPGGKSIYELWVG